MDLKDLIELAKEIGIYSAVCESGWRLSKEDILTLLKECIYVYDITTEVIENDLIDEELIEVEE